MDTSEAIHPDKHHQESSTAIRRSIGSLKSFRQESGVYLFFCENGNVAVQFVNEKVIRIKTFFDDEVRLASTIALAEPIESLAGVEVQEEADTIVLSSANVRAIVTRKRFSLFISDALGQPVYECRQITIGEHGSLLCENASSPDSHFYGLGEKTSYLDKRGERYENWNTDVYTPHAPEIEALYVSIPYLIHFRPQVVCGVFLDNPGRTVFDMRAKKDSYIMETHTGDLDYYVICGGAMKEVIAEYTALTGRMNLPPKWAVGYHQSRYSYMNQEEVLELAATFRNKCIPCDCIYLDIHYMNEYRVFTFDQARFPDPKGLVERLTEMGFQLVPIVDPGVKQDPKYPAYVEGIQGDYFCKKLEGDLFVGKVWPGVSAFPDFIDGRVAKWWGDKHAFYTDRGIRGIWNDMNEPAVFSETKTMDLDVVHRNNGDMKTHGELHNLYGMCMSKATYEGLLRHMNGERPFVLTRAGYAGIQRYAAVWTGDNRSFWEHMALAMPMMLNLGMSGVAFAGADIGGFAHHASAELLARWTQMGVFFPFCRNHSSIDTLRQEPWSFGPEIEEICRKYIGLRYQLMPYLYSLFFEASQTGMPIIRPLVLEYPQDEHVYNLCDQFLFGAHFLVAPIYRPDTEHRVVYLPEGVWVDYWTGARYEGRQHILAHAPLDTLPLFVKQGAIVPEVQVAQHAGDAVPTELMVSIYCGAGTTQSAFRLYEDDGRTFLYKEGAYNLLAFTYAEDASGRRLSYSYLHKGYAEGYRQFAVCFKSVGATPTRINGLPKVGLDEISVTSEGWAYDEARQEVTVKVALGRDGGSILLQ